ncbi:hypothetical protein IE53DRAFT_373890 [Violaceomyces palustris]|uniref:Uncharacterized protein n=1 Tax=Violaceomyces palustris TaxID=1673888 RepID=A0ACD0P1C2_9BASI|nr:hypothetical protein IE53DRAFT_373890 [Violaceomyces palustris]
MAAATQSSKESQSVFKAEDVGLLLVYSEPGEKLSLEEFQDWYDNEHVPLRTKRFTTFRSAARYKVAETFNPLNKVSDPTVINTSWGAFYAISSNALFEDPAYTSLRTERSPREAGIFARLGALDRRSYKLVYDSHQDGRIHNPPKSAEESLKPETKEEVERFSNHIVAHSVSVQDEEEYGKWFDEEHALMLSKCPGWTRTRRYILIDASVVGLKAAKDGKDVNEIPKILGLHEYANQDYIDSKEYKAAIDTPWRTKVLGPNGEKVLQRERKVQNLYRAWDPEVALREYEVKMKGKDKI